MKSPNKLRICRQNETTIWELQEIYFGRIKNGSLKSNFQILGFWRNELLLYILCLLLSIRSSEARASRGHVFFLSPDFYELWHSMMSLCLFTEVKWHCSK